MTCTDSSRIVKLLTESTYLRMHFTCPHGMSAPLPSWCVCAHRREVAEQQQNSEKLQDIKEEVLQRREEQQRRKREQVGGTTCRDESSVGEGVCSVDSGGREPSSKDSAQTSTSSDKCH